MIKQFVDDTEGYSNYRRDNFNYIDICSAFGNGYILRDRFNMITEDMVKAYGLVDDTGYIVDQETGEEYLDYTRYYVEDYWVVENLIKEHPELDFICLCHGEEYF